MAQVADRLGASAVAAGSVSRAGDQFEVKLRVFLAGADTSAWAETFPASSTTLVSLRRAASLSIARAMKIDVPTRILNRLNRPAAASSQAYESYALGRYLHAHASRAELKRAQVELERAIGAGLLVRTSARRARASALGSWQQRPQAGRPTAS